VGVFERDFGRSLGGFAEKFLPSKILFPGSSWIMGVFAQFQSRLPMFISTNRRTKEPALQSLGFGRLYMKENFILRNEMRTMKDGLERRSGAHCFSRSGPVDEGP
jgi:hypothetical protein